MKASILLLSLRQFKEDWRRAELRILAFALVIAVGAVSAVGFFTDRIHRAIEQQAADLLAADLRLSSPESLPNSFIDKAHSHGLQTAQFQTFPSVIMQGEQSVLVALKAVSEGYPLRGMMEVADAAYGPEIQTTAIPKQGSVWVENRLLNQLNLQVGDTLELGSQRLTIDKILSYEPDRGGLFFQFAPRVLMNLNDVEKTGLIGIGSRVKYTLLFAGESEQIKSYRTWLGTQVEPGQHIQGVEASQPELRRALERAEQFLGLAALIAVILAGAAIAVAAHYFSQKQADAAAMMRCFGATQSLILQIYLFRLILLGLLASSLGCLLGWFAQQGLSSVLAYYFYTLALPPPSVTPILLGFATGLITLFGFALPPVMRIQTVPPLRVLRRELGPIPLSSLSTISIAGIAMALLMFWQAGDTELAWLMIGGTLLTLLILMGSAYALVQSLGIFKNKIGVNWRFGLSNLARRAKTSSTQLTAFGLGLMALLLLGVVRVDLLNTWQAGLPEGTPNHFIINIQETDLKEFQKQTHTQLYENLYPMAVGRFIAINDQPVLAENYSNPRAKGFIERPFNLSGAATLPAGNQIIAGTFEHNKAQQAFSVEERFANTMGIKMGDQLTFQIANQTVSGQVTSLRAIQWDTFQVNFFVLATPDMIADLPKTYVTSFYLPETRLDFIPNLIRAFPSITVINVETLLKQVRELMNRATLAVQYVFLFTLLAGLMVLYAAISASHEERLYEGAILRTLGATRRQVLFALGAEFITLGILAGTLAAIAASGIAYVLAEHIFQLPYHFNIWIAIIGIIGGGIGIGIAGIIGTYTILQQPPSAILQKANF
jgi:putative ABC transport system permease protein